MNRIKNRLSISTVILILFIISFPICSSGQPVGSHRKVDKSTILFLFQHQLFKSLNSKLDEYQSAYDQDYQEEDNVYDAFDVFSRVDTEFESLFVKWEKESSEFPASYIARAKYYCACAREARGRKWLIDKDQKEYKEMERYYALALLDINIALKKNVRLDVCYAMMVEIGAATANEEMKGKALSDALKNHPYAYRIRLKYVQTLTPRFGGSYDMMKTFIDSCSKYVAFNPKIKALSASIPADRGSIFSYLGKYGEAVKMYTEALNYSNYHSYYACRGDAYIQLKDYVHALNDYDHALELSPNDPEYLSRKAKAIASQTSISNTGKANRPLQRFDSSNEKTEDRSLISERTQVNNLLEKGSNLANAGKYEEAVSEFSEVIRIVPYEYVAYVNRAICYSQLHNDDAALQDFLRVVELKPDYLNTYIRLIPIYANRGMYDDAINSANKWISLDPNCGEALYNRAKIYERKGSTTEALNDMRQACDLGYQLACRYYNQVK
ncbi:MAG: tetratricopeptide repeat protein [Bacteroidota bacterium]|jgi:tetratricopeptide (TPR) repeat protein